MFHFVQLTICKARLRLPLTSKQCSSMKMIAYFRSRFAQYVTPDYGSNNPARVVDVDGINCPTPGDPGPPRQRGREPDGQAID